MSREIFQSRAREGDIVCVSFQPGMVGEDHRQTAFFSKVHAFFPKPERMVHVYQVGSKCLEGRFDLSRKDIGNRRYGQACVEQNGASEHVVVFRGSPWLRICRRENHHRLPDLDQSPVKPVYGDGHPTDKREVVVREHGHSKRLP